MHGITTLKYLVVTSVKKLKKLRILIVNNIIVTEINLV